MEYLTLQDVPHRSYYDQRRMTSPDAHQGADKQLPGLSVQSHHMSMRHSPPFQPGEQRPSNTLPSFSQLLQNVREPSPPRTPSRRDGSMESSPASRTHFDDVAWSAEGKRRRNDTLGDIHRPSNVSDYSSSAYDSRRTSAADSLSGPVQQPNYPSAPNHHHRPSLPYSAPPQAAMGGHVRHHSTSGVHQAAPQYTHHQRPSVVAANSYHQPSGHPYDQHHGNYYPETHGNPYFGQPQYANVPHPGYEGAVAYHSQVPQYNYTFQAALNADQNSFNRRRRGNLPKEATALLKDWFAAHRESPYPTEDEKLELCRQTQLTLNQVSNWFINARRRAPGKEAQRAEAARAEAQASSSQLGSDS